MLQIELKITLKDNREIVLNADEAKELFQQLKDIYEKYIINPVTYPIIIEKNIYPSWQQIPVYPIITCGDTTGGQIFPPGSSITNIEYRCNSNSNIEIK